LLARARRIHDDCNAGISGCSFAATTCLVARECHSDVTRAERVAYPGTKHYLDYWPDVHDPALTWPIRCCRRVIPASSLLPSSRSLPEFHSVGSDGRPPRPAQCPRRDARGCRAAVQEIEQRIERRSRRVRRGPPSSVSELGRQWEDCNLAAGSQLPGSQREYACGDQRFSFASERAFDLNRRGRLRSDGFPPAGSA
jgi:hypothetical protein